MPKRTPSQKLAVATVRAVAKQIVAEIDANLDPRQTEFTAYFHLESWRTEPGMFQGQPADYRYGGPIFKTISRRLSS